MCVNDYFKFTLSSSNRLLMYKVPNLSTRLSLNKANFNHVLVCPLIELTVNTIGVKLVFVPEKYVSQSSFEEYKADAVVLHDGHQESFF